MLQLIQFVRERLTFQKINNRISIPIQNYINNYCLKTSDVSPVPTPYKLLKMDAAGKLPCDITGHAPTSTEAEFANNGLRPGDIIMRGSASSSERFLECDGRAISRTKYAELFAAIGITWGSGDGATTFNIPDFRGYFIRAWDHGRGVDPGRTLGSTQSDQIKSHDHTIRIPDEGQPSVSTGMGGSEGVKDAWKNVSTLTSGGDETRPKNIAVPFFIYTGQISE